MMLLAFSLVATLEMSGVASAVTQEDGRIVFVRSGDIYTMNPDGAEVQRLTRDGSNSAPAFSPDGQRITFSSSVDGDSDIYVMGSDGSNVEWVTANDAGDYDPTWSPDGQKIAFVGYHEAVAQIYVVDIDGNNQRQVTNEPVVGSDPDWGTNNKIAYGSDGDIYSINPDGSNRTKLASEAPNEFSPDWSPDGSKLSLVGVSAGVPSIYVMAADGTNRSSVAG
jgi:Tol biopolymer transport system component